MQDPAGSMENSEAEESVPGNGTDLLTVDDSELDTDGDSETPSMVLAEVFPGLVAVFGELPEQFKRELQPVPTEFGLVPDSGREKVASLLGSMGNSATLGGNFAHASAGLEGLYRTTDFTQAILNAGGKLAVKDGANIGAIFYNGKIYQARIFPVTKLSTAQKLASAGPALAMVALQLQLSEVAGLTKTNIALTSQVLTTLHHTQWSTLTALVDSVDKAFREAQAVQSVTQHVWEPVAAKRTELLAARDQYRRGVAGHIKKIKQLDAHGRREYLETNAEAIVFDAHALRSSLEAWTKYQVLRAARVSAADREEEAGLVEIIERETREEYNSALAETTGLVHSLTRELGIIAELPGRATVPLTRNRKDAKAARLTCEQLLDAIQPLAHALRPLAAALEQPDIVCAPEPPALDDPYLRILRWFLEDGETLRVLGFPDQLDVLGPFGATAGGAKEKIAEAKDRAVTTKEKVAAAIDKAAPKNLIAVTDRRIITAKTNAFRKHGQIGQDIPTDQIRYVRAPRQDGNGRSAIDVITSDENVRLIFHTDVDDTQVNALAAVLAESMTIPDTEHAQLHQHSHPALEPSNNQAPDTSPTEPLAPETALSDTE